MPGLANPERGRARLLAGSAALGMVALVGVMVLSPGGPWFGPEADASSYFPAELIERAESFRGPQRWLGLALTVAELGLLLALATVLLGRVGRLRAAAGGPEPLAAAAIGAALTVATFVAVLPIRLLLRERAVDAGLLTQPLGEWFGDRLIGLAITASLVAAGAALLIWLQRRSPRRWPALAAAAVVAYAAVVSWLAPVVLAPAVADFEPLPEGELRSDVLELAELAGVEVGDVLLVDASERGTGYNAYVSGLGGTRRVVLYDNLARGAERGALRSVIAHELAHVANRDIWRGILFVAIVAMPAMYLVAGIGTRLARRSGHEPGEAVAFVPYAFAISVVALVLGSAGNQLSRAVEREADRFALRLTNDPGGLVCLQQRVGAANLSDPDPPAVWQSLFGTHPSKVERIGAAERYASDRGLPVPDPATCRGGAGSAGGS